MVSNVESGEESWNSLKKQLSTTRRKQITTKRPNNYEEINKNKKFYNMGNTNNGAKVNDKPLKPSISDNNVNNNRNANKLPKNVTFDRSNSPALNTPTQYRNNTSARSNDAFQSINPLPDIKSPYLSARDVNYRYPNLESWGITNQPYEDLSSYRNVSPFLPVYNSLARNTKPYIVVPKLYRPLYQPPSPIMTDVSSNPRLNYINSIPYNRPVFSSLAEKYEKSNKIEEDIEKKLKSDQFIQSAQNVLKKSSTANEYDGNELFSTKFIEELDYKPEPLTIKPAEKKKVRILTPSKDPIAEKYIQSVKEEALIRVPPVDYKAEPKQRYNTSTAIDVAENIYRSEIEDIVRNIARNLVEEKKNFHISLQNPIYNNIFDTTIKEMLRDIAQETLFEHRKQVNFLQTNEIKKAAKDQLTDKLLLDRMLDTVAQHGKVASEDEEVVKLLDNMAIDILLNTHNDVRKVRDKTLKNYPLKKFHLNSFMTVALDILVSELQISLEDDLKDLDEIEKKMNKQ